MADRLDEIRARPDGIDLAQFEDSLTSVVQEMPCACPNGDDDGPATAACLAADAAYRGGVAAILELKIKRADVGWLLEHIEQLQAQLEEARRHRNAALDAAEDIRDERDALEAQRQAALNLCDAFDPVLGRVDVVSTRAVRAALGAADER